MILNYYKIPSTKYGNVAFHLGDYTTDLINFIGSENDKMQASISSDCATIVAVIRLSPSGPENVSSIALPESIAFMTQWRAVKTL